MKLVVRRWKIAEIRWLFLGLLLCTTLMMLMTELFGARGVGVKRPPPYAPQPVLLALDSSDGRRLGNILFNYAALVGIGKMNDKSPILLLSSPLRELFNLSCSFTHQNLADALGIHKRYDEFGRRASAYDANTRQLPAGNVILHGYFQSWKYFEDADEQIRREFTFRPEVRKKAELVLSRMMKISNKDSEIRASPVAKVTRVGIHVRRGDILKPSCQSFGYTTPPAEYYAKAMDYFKDKYAPVQFIVCSDDVRWAKEHLNGDDVFFSEGHSAAEDLALLSMADHSIVSVGSFGWWGAWLANGTTLYYDKWPKQFSKLEYHVNKKTYFPPHWIPFS